MPAHSDEWTFFEPHRYLGSDCLNFRSSVNRLCIHISVYEHNERLITIRMQRNLRIPRRIEEVRGDGLMDGLVHDVGLAVQLLFCLREIATEDIFVFHSVCSRKMLNL